MNQKSAKLDHFAAYACSDGCGDIVDGYDLYHLMAVFTIYNIAFIYCNIYMYLYSWAFVVEEASVCEDDNYVIDIYFFILFLNMTMTLT